MNLHSCSQDRHQAGFFLTGIIPNRKGQPLIQRWFGVVVINGGFSGFMDLRTVLERTGLGGVSLPNPGFSDDAGLDEAQKLLPDVIHKARQWMSTERVRFEQSINPRLNSHLKSLEKLRSRHEQGLREQLDRLDIAAKLKHSRGEQRMREIKTIFDEYIDWIEDAMTTEDQPYLKVAALLRRE